MLAHSSSYLDVSQPFKCMTTQMDEISPDPSTQVTFEKYQNSKCQVFVVYMKEENRKCYQDLFEKDIQNPNTEERLNIGVASLIMMM